MDRRRYMFRSILYVLCFYVIYVGLSRHIQTNIFSDILLTYFCLAEVVETRATTVGTSGLHYTFVIVSQVRSPTCIGFNMIRVFYPVFYVLYTVVQLINM